MTFRVQADDPESLRLASRFLIELDRPARFNNEATLKSWALVMDRLLKASGLDYEEFRWLLIWACRDDEFGNHFTAENLRVANDPAASLERQFDNTFKWFKAKRKVVELLKQKREEEELLAAGHSPLGDRCPNCQYSPNGERVLCLDCDDEYNQPDDGNYDLWRGSGPCEICRAPTEGESNLCWIHLFAAMG
jgi:hypothetical protein